MRNRSKLLLAAVAATALMGLAVGTASATRLEVPNWERGFRITWAQLQLEAGGNVIRCPVTLEGSFSARSIVKRAGNEIGSVTRAIVNNAGCERGRATVLTTNLPWRVQYDSFAGTLPNITGVTLRLIGAEFQAETGSITCLARTTEAQPARGIGNVRSGAISEFTAESSAGIETRGGFFCSIAGASHFSGTGSASVLGETAAIQLRLI